MSVIKNSIFISHSSADNEFANRLAKALRINGVKVWIDEAEMMVGDSLLEKIKSAIDEMNYLGVVLSPKSVKSQWVQREVQIALDNEITGKKVKVLPLLYKDCNIPPFLKGKVCADFRKEDAFDGNIDFLLKRLLPSPEIIAYVARLREKAIKKRFNKRSNTCE